MSNFVVLHIIVQRSATQIFNKQGGFNMFSCNQGKGCYMNQPSSCCQAAKPSCYDQLDDAIDVIQSIYDLADDYLSTVEDEEDTACGCGCGCKSDYNDCGCKPTCKDYDYKPSCSDCGCTPKYYDRDYDYDDDDCGYNDDYYDDCKEPYRYWGRKGCNVQKQDCNNYLPRKDKKCCKRRRGYRW